MYTLFNCSNAYIQVHGNNLYFRNKEEVKVYHCTSSTCNPFKWKNVEKNINNNLHKYPLNSAVWYPHLKFIRSLFFFKIAAILFHFIPAYILDAVTSLCGGRRMYVLVLYIQQVPLNSQHSESVDNS